MPNLIFIAKLIIWNISMYVHMINRCVTYIVSVVQSEVVVDVIECKIG